MQLTHYNTKFNAQQFPVVLVCDNVTNAPNIGSLFRIADAFGLEKILFCGELITISRKVQKTSRSAEKVVAFEQWDTVTDALKHLKNDGYAITALEITSNSEPIHSISFQKKQPIALVIGNENFGVSDAALKLSDQITHIDMFGRNSSMNVVQAASIAIYEITKQIM